MHQILRSARDVVEQSCVEGENLKVVWELRDRRALEENAPVGEASSDSDSEAGQQDDETISYTGDGEALTSQTIDNLMGVSDDAAGWRQTCAFFGHDESKIAIHESHCRPLPGTKRALRPHQMYDVHNVFQSVTNGTGDIGAILAHQMGVGKTIMYQAIIAVRRLAVISAAHYARYPHQHHSPGAHCGLAGRPFGIQCACEKDGLTAKIVHAFQPGATLLLVPASIAEQTLREANAYFSPKLEVDGLGETGGRFAVNFITCLDYAEEPAKSEHKVAAAADIKVHTHQKQLLPSRTKSSVVFNEEESLAMLKATGFEYSLVPKPELRTTPSSTVLVVTTQFFSRDSSWGTAWKGRISLDISGGRQAQLTVGGHCYFGLVVWDEAHEIRQSDTNFAKVLFSMLARQEKPPMIVPATGSPVTDNLSDMTLLFSLIRNKTTKSAIKLLEDQLRKVDVKLRPGASDAEKAEAASDLRGFYRRTSGSNFRGHRITIKGKPVFETHDCPVDQTYTQSISELTQSVGASILKKLRESRARKPDNVEPKGRAATDLGLIQKDKQLRRLELAIHFPGLIAAWRDARESQASVPMRADTLLKVIGKGDRGSHPTTYLRQDLVPPAIWDSLDYILSHSSRLAKLHEICMTALADTDAYPREDACWDGFRGPKNVLVFTKWPILAYLIQLWFEKCTDHDSFRSALIHSKLNRTERQEVVDWFRTFTVDSQPKTFTKVLVTTYRLCGTGLDDLKVANYCVHFGAVKNINERDQASGRVDRQGQPLTTHIYYLESQEQPLDRLTARIRDSRDDLFGGDGLLGEIAAFAGEQSNAG
ncbi:hypothetical protein LX36DRAFT_589337 [Colletotrichum falcatum]|nr:hypothetical protein LX36DRAFT_589337 [Colletotrichum falcatum]